jgi:hypothetical protein
VVYIIALAQGCFHYTDDLIMQPYLITGYKDAPFDPVFQYLPNILKNKLRYG